MNQKNIRILAMPLEIGRAHMLRLVLIARELRRRGAEVAFTWKEQDEVLKHEGFQVFCVSGQDLNKFTEDTVRKIVDANTLSLTQQCVKDEIEAIWAFKPDAILGDLRSTAAISAKICKIPYISVVNGYWTHYFKMVAPMLRFSREKHLLKHKFDFAAAKVIQDKLKIEYATNFRLVAEQYGIRNLESIYDFLAGDLTLIADMPQYCPLENLPKNYRYIGPLVWEGLNETVPAYLEARSSSKPLIYATIGNTGCKRLIQLVVDAFQNDDSYEVVLTTGAYISPDKVPKISNIHVERFIPGSQVMQRAQAVIHCGGSGTTHQALLHSLPALVIPFNTDQEKNAFLMEKNKLGICLSPSKLTGNEVRLAVKEVLEDTDIQKNLQHFKDLLKRTDAPKSAADEITSFFNQTHLREHPSLANIPILERI